MMDAKIAAEHSAILDRPYGAGPTCVMPPRMLTDVLPQFVVGLNTAARQHLGPCDTVRVHAIVEPPDESDPVRDRLDVLFSALGKLVELDDRRLQFKKCRGEP